MEGIRIPRDITFDFDLDNTESKRERKEEVKEEKKIVEEKELPLFETGERLLNTEFGIPNGKEEEEDPRSRSSEDTDSVPSFLHKLSSDDQQIPEYGTVFKRSIDNSPNSSVDDFIEEFKDPHEFYTHAIKELDCVHQNLKDLKKTASETRKHDEPHDKKDEDDAVQHRMHIVTEIDATLEATANIVDFVGAFANLTALRSNKKIQEACTRIIKILTAVMRSCLRRSQYLFDASPKQIQLYYSDTSQWTQFVLEHPSLRDLIQRAYDHMEPNLGFYTFLAGAVSVFIGIITGSDDESRRSGLFWGFLSFMGITSFGSFVFSTGQELSVKYPRTVRQIQNLQQYIARYGVSDAESVLFKLIDLLEGTEQVSSKLEHNVQLKMSDCAICFEPLSLKRIGRPDECLNHFFHCQCLELWMQRNRVLPTCPICRKPFSRIAVLKDE